MSATAHPTTSGLVSRAGNGALAGIAGGIVFGILMAMMGMLPLVGLLIGVENAAVGFGVHLVNSAIIGVLAWRLAGKIGPVLSAGLVYGVIWWVLGALLIMPLWLSVTADPMMRDMVFIIGSDQWMSLMGHAIFGLITAATLYGLRHRAHS